MKSMPEGSKSFICSESCSRPLATVPPSPPARDRSPILVFNRSFLPEEAFTTSAPNSSIALVSSLRLSRSSISAWTISAPFCFDTSEIIRVVAGSRAVSSSTSFLISSFCGISNVNAISSSYHRLELNRFFSL